MFRRNVTPYPNIVPIQAALWSHDGTIAILSPGRGEWFFVTQEGTGVRAVTLSSLCREWSIAKIDLLKCDVEGAEREAFRSCDCMESIENIVIGLHDFLAPGCSATVETVTHSFIRSQRDNLVWFRRR
jgi:FkbM family methyltransferase